jgi:hypothetical protein
VFGTRTLPEVLPDVAFTHYFLPETRVICHVRLKRSGAWWYEESSNHMLALRCAKYNGTFEQVFTRDQHQKADA